MSIHPGPDRPPGSGGSSSTRESAQLAQFLCRPIVFREPQRVVHPPSWLEHVPFAFWLVDALRPAVFVELGTQSGNSYASFAQAVQMLGLSTAAYAVDTWRGDPQSGFYDERVFTEWADYHDRHFAAFSRLIRATFDEAVEHFADGTIDLLHIDGCHTYEAASADFERWRPKQSRRGVTLFHDINVREGDFGVWRLWEELKTQSPSFEFLHGHGLGVLAAGPDLPEPLQWLFSRPSFGDEVGAVRQFFARLGGVVSARFAAAEIARHAGARETDRSPVDPSVEAQTAREHEVRPDTSPTMADLPNVSDDGEDRRRAEAELAQEVMQLRACVSNLEDQVSRQAREHQERIRQDIEVVAELQARVRDESERRRRLEAERDRLASTSRRLSAAIRQQIQSVESGWRRRLRYLRKISRTPRALGLLPTARQRAYRSALAFFTHPARFRAAQGVALSGLFDEAYYRSSYPDVSASRLTPLAHFVLKGASEGRSPHPLFDTAYYLRRNPDVAATGINPLVHYREQGAFDGRSPHPLFDVVYYLDTNPDVKEAGIEPLSHFLAVGALEGRNPNPFFDCSYYLRLYPDVARLDMNPLSHFVLYGWREGRRPSAAFDTAYYLSRDAGVRLQGEDPLTHYIECGRFEGRATMADPGEEPSFPEGPVVEPPHVDMKVRTLGHSRTERPAVLCLSHVMPWPPRAGNEYRIYRMLRWLRDQGYRIVPIIAPLPGEQVDAAAVRMLADEFSNAVLCDRDGRLEYVLSDVPDVLASLGGGFTRPVAALLDEDAVRSGHERQLLQMDRTFCHDALITATLRLQQVLGPHVLLTEYIWMSRILPLVSGDVVKVMDTIDVFSTKREKVLQFGIDDLHVEPREEAKRLRDADLILAIQDDERQELQQLVPAKRVVVAGVDFDVVEDAGIPSGRQVLYVASDNPMNIKGLADFLRFAWPHIRRKVPDAQLLVAGKVGNRFDAEVPGVVQLGPVDNLRPLYTQARVVINPAVAGTGLKIKTLEALGHLRPIVAWPNGTDGLARELAAFCVTVQDWYEFSRRVAVLLAAPEPPLFSRADRDTISRLTSPATVYREMTEAIESLREKRSGSELAGPGLRV